MLYTPLWIEIQFKDFLLTKELNSQFFFSHL